MVGVDTAQNTGDTTNCTISLCLNPIPKADLYKIAHSKPINKNTRTHDRVSQKAMRVMHSRGQLFVYVLYLGMLFVALAGIGVDLTVIRQGAMRLRQT
jgi:hypothetical protein